MRFFIRNVASKRNMTTRCQIFPGGGFIVSKAVYYDGYLSVYPPYGFQALNKKSCCSLVPFIQW